MIDHDRIVTTLVAALRALPEVRGAWLGGSAANARSDQWSDIDLQVIARDDSIEAAFEAIEAALQSLSPIEYRIRLPQPTWHGHDQAFYRLREADPCLLVDLVVLKQSSTDRFLERERHGVPVVLFDHDDVIKPGALDREAHWRRIEARRRDLEVRFPLFQCFALKSVARGLPVEAMAFYHAFTLRPLVDALRILHCPDRFDFGLRYLHLDLPQPVYDEVGRLAFPRNGADIERFQKRAEEMFRETMAQLARADEREGSRSRPSP